MKRGLVIVLFFVILIPLASSMSLKELIEKYVFSASTPDVELTGYSDYMIDKNENGINDTLVFELISNNIDGNFIFIVNLLDKNGIITNETNIILASGTNKINITFDTSLLSQNQLNYSIKVYNSSYSLKYRKDKILTQNYPNYEEGFRIIDAKDFVVNNALQINFTINSSINGTFETILFLSYNDSTISIKVNQSINSSILSFDFDNETIKKTHYTGKFNISSLKIGKKILKTDFSTSSYNFRNFAASSYLDDFFDSGYDSNHNGKYNSLQIMSNLKILEEGYYSSTLYLYDLFDNAVEIKNSSSYFMPGSRTLRFDINGSLIQSNKLNGPFVVKRIELLENGTLKDVLNNAYTTNNYNFGDFDNSNLPDLNVSMSITPDYHYGINNLTINFSFRNIGGKPAFNVFTEIFDNGTFSRPNKSNILGAGSELKYQLALTNASDFEVTALADSNDFIEESNENNNAQKMVIKINKKPLLNSVSNFTVNETDKIIINLSASDENDDSLVFSVNNSKFTNKSNAFEWQTTTIDSGNYTIEASVSDGYLNDSKIFNIAVIDNSEIDSDNDGINDSIDSVIGDEKAINTSTLNITILLNDSINLSRSVNGTNSVKINDGNLTIAEFDFDFSAGKLNFTNFTFNKQSGNSTGSVIFSGLKLSSGTTKNLYVDKLNSAFKGICIKDEEILLVSEISANCNSNNEFKIECDGTLQDGYSCAYNSTINKYKIKGLKHSGIIQFDYSKTASNSGGSSSSGSGSSGGGGSAGEAICVSNWNCDEWSNCVDKISTRKCEDTNKCSSPSSQPQLIKECSDEKKATYPSSFTGNKNKINNSDGKIELPNSFGITGAVIKSISLNSYAGVFIVLTIIILITGFYLNRKHQILKIFK